MEVYLIPVGGTGYELYCESDDEPELAPAAPSGFRGKLLVRFQTVVDAAERARHPQPAGDEAHQTSAWGRLKAGALRWVAEKIAEQRLLWRLQRPTEATAHHPDDTSEVEASGLLLGILRRDRDRHRRWLIIDGLIFVASGVLTPLPGPNVIAYYFAFRVVGHYLSMRGAKNGYAAIRWRLQPSAALTDLRAALSLGAPDRDAALERVAAALHLDHLVTFVRRTAAITD